MRGLALVTSLALVCVCALAEESGGFRREAKLLRDQGAEAYERGDYIEALDHFEKAYALFPSPNLHYNLARALSDLGRDLEALEQFEFFLAKAPEAPAQARGVAAAKIAVLEKRVAYLDLRCVTADAELRVDGKHIGKGPLANRLRVMPGDHLVNGERAGHTPYIATVSLRPGETRAVEVKLLVPIAQKPVYKKWWFWTTLGGIAAVATGATLAGIYAHPQSHTPSLGTVPLSVGGQ